MRLTGAGDEEVEGGLGCDGGRIAGWGRMRDFAREVVGEAAKVVGGERLAEEGFQGAEGLWARVRHACTRVR